MDLTELEVIKYIRSKSICGLYEAQYGLNLLIEALKHRPMIMDNPQKLIIKWENPIDEYILDELARNEYPEEYSDDMVNSEVLRDVFKAGYKKAKESI